MRPRFSPVGWPGAPASSSVRSPIAEKGSGIPRAPLLPTVKCQPNLAVASIGELPISGGAGRGMNMSKLSAHARPSRPSSFTVALTVALTVCSEGERGATPKPSVCVSTNHGCRPGSSSELSTTLCIQNTHMRLDRVSSRVAATLAYGCGLTRRRLNRDSRGTMGGESPSWTITEGFAPFQWSSAVFDQMFRCTEPRTGPRSNVDESPTIHGGGCIRLSPCIAHRSAT